MVFKQNDPSGIHREPGVYDIQPYRLRSFVDHQNGEIKLPLILVTASKNNWYCKSTASNRKRDGAP